MNVLFLLTLPPFLTLIHAATLRIIEAGVPGGPTEWGIGVELTPTIILCEADLFPSYSIECVPDNPVSFATFLVDGIITRRENLSPYVLTGDFRGVAKPWSPPSSSVEVTCALSNTETVSSQIIFSCSVGGTPPRPEPMPPNPPPSPSEPTKGPTMGGKNGCLRIKALDYVSKKGMWTTDGMALIYKDGDPSLGIDGPGTAPVEYEFVAPVTSRYAVTLDMETDGAVDHNDVWMEFEEGGFSLEKINSPPRDSKGWTKVYHNSNGRAVLAFSVDFTPHSISTKLILRKGVKYTIRVAGRSTKVALYGIVMFPCTGSQCVIGAYWNVQVAMCTMTV